ncbi:hypothetical protein D0A34_22695 [Microcoleus vaginatus PCC 9802]|nr:hypothetical protein D0A34_22695 [Microcoleus vaginatus PCC 9802]
MANYVCRVRRDHQFFLIYSIIFVSIALWKLWKKKLTAGWASPLGNKYLWKTCGKAVAVDRPPIFVQKLFRAIK